MKIFTEEEGSFNHKVNFVDVKNNAVGYDLSQDCCEDADWSIIGTILDSITYEDTEEYRDHKSIVDIDLYSFDVTFYKCQFGVLDDGGVAIFKLKAKDKPDIYLHLFNSHNGYYGHGFTFDFHRGNTL